MLSSVILPFKPNLSNIQLPTLRLHQLKKKSQHISATQKSMDTYIHILPPCLMNLNFLLFLLHLAFFISTKQNIADTEVDVPVSPSKSQSLDFYRG